MDESSNPKLSAKDRIEQYFRIKDVLKDYRGQIKDLMIQHEDYPELEQLTKQMKVLRDKIKSDEAITEVINEMSALSEKLKDLRQIIAEELALSNEAEVSNNGRKLTLVKTLKEGRG